VTNFSGQGEGYSQTFVRLQNVSRIFDGSCSAG
jgi:hypothetical protein